jgi:hypothetical protein
VLRSLLLLAVYICGKKIQTRLLTVAIQIKQAEKENAEALILICRFSQE